MSEGTWPIPNVVTLCAKEVANLDGYVTMCGAPLPRDVCLFNHPNCPYRQPVDEGGNLKEKVNLKPPTVLSEDSMPVIWKYVLPTQDEVLVEMPVGARPLYAGTQFDTLCVWALIPKLPTHYTEYIETHVFRVVGTGHPIDFDINIAQYLGTYFLLDGKFVGHVFHLGVKS